MSINTVAKLLVDAGKACAEHHDKAVRGVKAKRVQVDEVWFVDPEAKAIRVLAREGAGYRLAGEYGAGDRLAWAALPGVDLDVAAVFA